MPAIIASNFPDCKAGIIPSQSCSTIVQFLLIILHSSVAKSTSKPMSFPEASLAFHGGYAPSVPILILSENAFPDNKKREAKKVIKSLLNVFIYSPIVKSVL